MAGNTPIEVDLETYQQEAAKRPTLYTSIYATEYRLPAKVCPTCSQPIAVINCS